MACLVLKKLDAITLLYYGRVQDILVFKAQHFYLKDNTLLVTSIFD